MIFKDMSLRCVKNYAGNQSLLLLAFFTLMTEGCGNSVAIDLTPINFASAKSNCEDSGGTFSGEAADENSWLCVLPEPTPTPTPEPTPTPAPEQPAVPSPTPVPSTCVPSSLNYCGGASGYTFSLNRSASRGSVTFVLTGLESRSNTRFIYWQEGSGYWYNSVLYARSTHRAMINNNLIEDNNHNFNPSRQYTFVVSWRPGSITQESFEEDGTKICSLPLSASISNVNWVKIGTDNGRGTFGSNFRIVSATVSLN